jgi:RND family efflux transporter MFP subunit
VFRKLFTIIGTVGILAAGAMLIGVMGAMRPKVKPQAPVVTPPTVFYAVAEPRSTTLDVYAQGEVRPRTDIALTAQVSGRIEKTAPAFVDGGAFEAGELLIKVEDADYRLAVTSARARVAEAEESLKREEAEAALARKDYEELGRQTDPSELALRLPQLAQARAAYEAARADFKASELNLDRTEIRAPFKGRVRTRSAGEGQFVSPGTQLGRIFSTDVAEIRLALTDNDLGKLGLPIAFVETVDQQGPPVLLSAVIAGAEHRWKGRIARTDGALDPTTRQISAIAVVEDPYGAGSDDGAPLAIGLYVDARIEGRTIENAIVLPRSALYGRDAVYVIAADDALSRRTVSVVSADRSTIIISDGVAPGERVAISPLRGADDGDKVAPVDPKQPDAPDGDQTPTPQRLTADALNAETGL